VSAPSAATSQYLSQRQRPLCIGCSIGVAGGGAGTLGLFVTDKEKRRLALTSREVVALPGTPRRPVHQPAPVDVASPAMNTMIGLVAAATTLNPRHRLEAHAAIIELIELVETTGNVVPRTFPHARMKLRGIWESKDAMGSAVAKIGRTTGYTEGSVSSVAMSMAIQGTENRVYQFDNLIEIKSAVGEPFSQPGDGGAVVFDPSNGRLLGLVVAGGKTAKGHITYVCPIEPILEELNVQIDA
jgi:hypothetical protein